MEKWTLENFADLNAKYRAGEMSKELKNDAERLFSQALAAYLSGNVPGKDEDFISLLRSLTVSFECLEFYMDITPEMYDFFLGFLKDFLRDTPRIYMKNEIELWFSRKLSEINKKTRKRFELQDKKKFNELATEAILILLASVNCLYRQDKYEKGKESLDKIYPFINYLAEAKKAASQTEVTTLYALAKYFEGEINFALGDYQTAEICFKTSADGYLKKILFTDGISPKDYETRVLATRRYALAQILGLARLYYKQSLLTESLKMCEKSIPFLKNTGDVMKAYASMIKQITIRDLHSDSETHLTDCRLQFEKSLKIFESEVENTSYPLRCRLEISITVFFMGRLRTGSEKLKLFDEALGQIDVVLNSISEREKRNNRVLAKANSLKSYALRNYPETNLDQRLENLNQAIVLAEESVRLSCETRQVNCECLIALGLAYKKKLGYLLKIQDEAKYEPEQKRRQLNKDIQQSKNKAKEKFVEALDLSENPRIYSLGWLHLADLELISDQNHQWANYYFEKHQKHKVQHKYITNFAEKLKARIIDAEKKFPIFQVNFSANMTYEYWEAQLRDFFYRNLLFKIAREKRGIIPSKTHKLRKGNLSKPSKAMKKENFFHDENRKKTASGTLIKSLMDELKCSKHMAEKIAKDYIDKFVAICEEVRKDEERENSKFL